MAIVIKVFQLPFLYSPSLLCDLVTQLHRDEYKFLISFFFAAALKIKHAAENVLMTDVFPQEL